MITNLNYGAAWLCVHYRLRVEDEYLEVLDLIAESVGERKKGHATQLIEGLTN
jgi:hypothetical protein